MKYYIDYHVKKINVPQSVEIIVIIKKKKYV